MEKLFIVGREIGVHVGQLGNLGLNAGYLNNLEVIKHWKIPQIHLYKTLDPYNQVVRSVSVLLRSNP